jgi:hypothetical protein
VTKLRDKPFALIGVHVGGANAKLPSGRTAIERGTGTGREKTASPSAADLRPAPKAVLFKGRKDVSEVQAIRMLSGALVADSFDGPELDTQTWHRPDWLVKNDPNLCVGIRNAHLRISGVSRPAGRDHQYTGVLSTYFRETDVVLSARIRVATSFDKPNRIRHLVHLCTGDWPDFFTEIDFGKIGTGPARWHCGYVDRIWKYSGYGEYLAPTLPATGKEASDWHEVVIVHDGTTHVGQNYLIQSGAWKPVGPPHKIKMNHSLWSRKWTLRFETFASRPLHLSCLRCEPIRQCQHAEGVAVAPDGMGISDTIDLPSGAKVASACICLGRIVAPPVA